MTNKKGFSVFGLFSVIFGFLSISFITLIFVVVIFLEEFASVEINSNPDIETLLDFSSYGSIVFAIFGSIFGLIGLFQKAKSNLLPIIGIFFSLPMILIGLFAFIVWLLDLDIDQIFNV